MLRRILRDPLGHFLLGGRLLFLLFGLVGRGDPARDVIVVDRATLLGFVQQRTKAFDPALAATRLDALSPAARQRLIEDYVREEALHREALALGLDAGDYVIRRRLVQKLEFVAQGFGEAGAAPSEEELAEFFAARSEEYAVEPAITFAHVFFDAERRGREAARRAAEAAREELAQERVPFSEATRHGDRFLYHVNYVERTPDYVASHFGKEMADALFALDPEETGWRGPFESPYGSHVVLVTARKQGRTPALDEIRGRVLEDARRARIRELSEEALRGIVERYEVRVLPEANGS